MAKKRTLMDDSQGEQINPQLLQLASNIVFPGDIRVKHNYWKTEVIVYKGWFEKHKGWTRNFSFLPHPEDWGDIKTEVIKELEKAKTTPCFVMRSTNNVLQFILQPLSHDEKKVFGADFLRPDFVLFFKGGKDNTWKEHTQMYRIIGSDYIDTKRLTFLITAKKDYCWTYHLNVLSSPARVIVDKSQLIRYDPNDPDYREYPDVCFPFCSDLRRVKYFQSMAKGSGKPEESPGTPVEDDWQPTFCLAVSTIDTQMESLIKKAEGDEDEKVGFSRFYPEGMHSTSCPAFKGNGACGKNNTNCKSIPALALLKPATEDVFNVCLSTSTDIHFFLYPKKAEKHTQNTPNGVIFPSYYMDDDQRDDKPANANYSNAFQSWLPEPFNEQPHLIASEHSSVQFFFMRKLVHTALLNQCKITYEKEDGNLNLAGGLQVRGKKFGERFGTTKHVLLYMVKTRASTAGICYHFESGSQIWRVELGVSGFAAGKNAALLLIAKMQSDMDKQLGNLGGDDNSSISYVFRMIGKLITAALPGWIAGYIKKVKTDPSVFLKENNLDKLKDEAHSSTDTTETGETTRKLASGESFKNPITHKLEETAKWSDSGGHGGKGDLATAKYNAGYSSAKSQAIAGSGWGALGKSCEKSLFFVNTTNIDYNMGEYFSRSMKNPFEIRYEMSNQLYDALYNNNNSPVAQELDNRIACLNNLILDHGAQEIQARVDLFYDGDIGTEYMNAFATGTIIYRRKTFDRDFPQLSLKHANLVSSMKSMLSSDPGIEAGIANIKGGAKGGKKQATSDDNICPSDNQILFLHGRPWVKRDGTNILEEYMKQTPNFKGNGWDADKAGWSKSWDLPAGKYEWWWKIWNGPETADSMDCPKGVKMTIEQLPGGGKGGSNGTMVLTMEAPSEPGGIEIPPMSSVPPVARGDDTPPNTSTLGGRPNPTGGGGIEDTSSDIDEMGFSMDTTGMVGGMEFDMDMGMNVSMNEQEVNQMTTDIFEDTSVSDEFQETTATETVQTQEDVDTQNTKNENKEQTENSEETIT